MIAESTSYTVDMLYNFFDKTMRCTRTFDSLSEARKYASDVKRKYYPESISIAVRVNGIIEDF